MALSAMAVCVTGLNTAIKAVVRGEGERAQRLHPVDMTVWNASDAERLMPLSILRFADKSYGRVGKARAIVVTNRGKDDEVINVVVCTADHPKGKRTTLSTLSTTVEAFAPGALCENGVAAEGARALTVGGAPVKLS